MSDDSAFPKLKSDLGYGQAVWLESGLTKRELFAAMVMQGMQSRPMLIVTMGDETLTKLRAQMATDAVSVADALLAELAKERK